MTGERGSNPQYGFPSEVIAISHRGTESSETTRSDDISQFWDTARDIIREASRGTPSETKQGLAADYPPCTSSGRVDSLTL
jgi:hypothetical protein